MKLLLSLLIIVLLYSCGNKEIYKDVSQPVDKRVEDLMQRMTLDEKLILLSGDSTGFATKTIKRFNIPSIFMTDGPLGVRWKKSTAFPSAQATNCSCPSRGCHSRDRARGSTRRRCRGSTDRG